MWLFIEMDVNGKGERKIIQIKHKQIKIIDN